MAQSVVPTDNPLPYFRSPLSLQTIASFEVAIHLLRHEVHREHAEHENETPFDPNKFKIPECLGLPKVIRDKIEDSIKQFDSELYEWVHLEDVVENYNSEVIENSEDIENYSEFDRLKKCIDCVIIGNREKTVRNILDSDQFTVVEKYKIACKYCFEDDIKTLWNSVSDNVHVTQIELDCGQDIVYYWNCIMMNSVPAYQVPDDQDHSIEYCLIKDRDSDLSWMATEYLWNKLTSEERFVATVLIAKEWGPRFLVEFLPKLNQLETICLLTAIPVKVLFSLADQVEYFDYVLQIWDYYCSFASEEAVCKTLVEISSSTYSNNLMMGRTGGGYQLSWALGQLWLRTSSMVKNLMYSEERVKLVFEEIDFKLCDSAFPMLPWCTRDTSFLLEILKGANSKIRNEIWLKNWHKLIFQADPLHLDQFMKICFENDEQILTFKQTEMANFDNLEREFEWLITLGHLEPVFNYINVCSTDPLRKQNLCRRIIASCFGHLKRNVKKFKPSNFDKLVEKSFSNEQLANQFKNEYLLAFENGLLQTLFALLEEGGITYVLKVCNYLSFELLPRQTKREFLQRYSRYLNRNEAPNFEVNIWRMIQNDYIEFKVDEWREFVTKCTESEQDVAEFKRLLVIDRCFDNIFNSLVQLLVNGQDVDFSSLDHFLLWFFNCKEATSKFKLSKVNDNRIRITLTIQSIIREKNYIFDKVSMWFFDGDDDQIQNLKSSIFST